jgi:hypothetical protein
MAEGKNNAVENIKEASLFVGEHAGEAIEEKINGARTSIKIISPHLGDEQVKLLIHKANENVNVKVISSDWWKIFNIVGLNYVNKILLMYGVVCNIIIALLLIDEYKNRKIYAYIYSTVFPIKFIDRPKKNTNDICNKFFHSKIYMGA